MYLQFLCKGGGCKSREGDCGGPLCINPWSWSCMWFILQVPTVQWVTWLYMENLKVLIIFQRCMKEQYYLLVPRVNLECKKRTVTVTHPLTHSLLPNSQLVLCGLWISKSNSETCNWCVCVLVMHYSCHVYHPLPHVTISLSALCLCTKKSNTPNLGIRPHQFDFIFQYT